MKVAVSSTGINLESEVDSRIGRCPYFIIVDTDTITYEYLANPCTMDMCLSGVEIARMLAAKGVQVLLTGDYGPDVQNAFSESGIRLVRGHIGISVRAAVQRFKWEERV